MQRLGRNQGAYLGETIDIQAVLHDIEAAARKSGWSIDLFCQTPEFRLVALRRPARAPDPARSGPRVYISAGIHGDEPAGPLAVRRLLEKDAWPPHLDLWICPCLNPTGFPGVDLNPQYRDPTAPETIAHVRWLEAQPNFDLSLCLHEDWESRGFYLYELNPDQRPPLGERVVEQVKTVCPIDSSELIEGRAARQGVIRPDIDPGARPDWPEAFFLITRKSRQSCTLEAPSDFPLPVRVAALVSGVNAALGSL